MSDSSHDPQTGAIEWILGYVARTSRDEMALETENLAQSQLTAVLARVRELEAEKANHWRSGAAEGGKDG